MEHSLKYKWRVFWIFFGVFLGILSDALVPLYYKKILDILAMENSRDAQAIMPAIWGIFFLGIINWVGYRLATYINNYFQPRVMADLLNTCYRYLQAHSYSFFTNSFTGSLVKKVTRYSRAFEDISDQFFWSIGPVVFRLIIVLVVLYFRQWTLSALLLGWSLIYVGFNYAYARFKIKYDVMSAEADTKTTAHLADAVTNNINIKLFEGQRREIETHEKLTANLFRLRKLSWDLSSHAEAIQAGLMVFLELAVLLMGVHYWKAGVLTVGDFALLQAYLMQIFARLWDLGRYIRRIYQNLADAEEMTDVLMLPHEIKDAEFAGTLSVASGRIDFVGVNFAYGRARPILSGFDLVVKPGERVALIGPSGGGKSTIVKLLFRFHDIQSGKILIDGQPIAGVTQSSLRNALALVPQEPILFHRSLMENIRYARPEASDAEVVAAAKLAHCHEFIEGFPEKYHTFVGERGVKLSGGERQRVAIARAILKNAPVLVLDEATSSLDSESEHYIQDALRNLMRGKTTIVIAHRLSTIMQMDRIIVLDGGKILEEGKHKELLKIKKGIYQKLWQIQAGGFSK